MITSPRPEDNPHTEMGNPDLPARPEDLDHPSTDSAADEPLDTEDESLGWFGWRLLFVLLLMAALLAAGVWGVRRAMQSVMVAELDQSFRNVSLLPQPRVQPESVEMKLQIYYVAGGRMLGATERLLRQTVGSTERLHLIARELQEPPGSGLYASPFPPAGEIRGLYLFEGMVWIDLNEAFRERAQTNPLTERLMIYSIVNSFLLNDTSLEGVRFMIEGQPVKTAWGWLDLSSPLGPDLSLIQR